MCDTFCAHGHPRLCHLYIVRLIFPSPWLSVASWRFELIRHPGFFQKGLNRATRKPQIANDVFARLDYANVVSRDKQIELVSELLQVPQEYLRNCLAHEDN